jgi:DNA invertase Pin-like site-specific DNA recombinase
MKGLQDIVQERTNRGALKVTEQSIGDDTAAGKALLNTLGVFGEFETNLRKVREAEGIIAPARPREGYKGGTARIDPEALRKLAGEGMQLTISRVHPEPSGSRCTGFCPPARSRGSDAVGMSNEPHSPP